MAKARQIVGILEDTTVDVFPDCQPTHVDHEEAALDPESLPTAFRVQTRQSPYMDTFYDHHPVRVTIDSGATGNMIRQALVRKLGALVKASSQSAHQADGSSPLNVVGDTQPRKSKVHL